MNRPFDEADDTGTFFQEYNEYITVLKRFVERNAFYLNNQDFELTEEQIEMRVVLKIVQRELKQAEEEIDFFKRMV